MIRIGRRRDAYQFSDRVHPKEGIISVVIGIVMLCSFIAMFFITSRQQGGLVVGLIGIINFICSMVGLWFGIKVLKKEDIHYRMPILGIILNGIVLIVSVSLYFVGMASNIKIS